MSDHYVYMIVWPLDRVVKAGYSAHRERWERYAGIRDGQLHYLAAFDTKRLALAHEATILAVLDAESCQAFEAQLDGTTFGIDRGGWTECYRMPTWSKTIYELPTPVGGRVVLDPPTYKPVRELIESTIAHLPAVAS